MRETIWECLYGDGLVGHMTAARQRIDPVWDGCMETLKEMWTRAELMDGKATTDAGMSRAMERYNAEVQETVPADRLLVWSPKDGWEPLCAFLELPVPEAPFPRIHDSKAFGQTHRRRRPGGRSSATAAPSQRQSPSPDGQAVSHIPVRAQVVEDHLRRLGGRGRGGVDVDLGRRRRLIGRSRRP